MIDWDEIRSRKLPKIIEAKFDHFIYVWYINQSGLNYIIEFIIDN